MHGCSGVILGGAGIVASWLLTADLPQERWGWGDIDPFHACYLIIESSDYIHCMLLRTLLSLHYHSFPVLCTFLPIPRNTGGRVVLGSGTPSGLGGPTHSTRLTL